MHMVLLCLVLLCQYNQDLFVDLVNLKDILVISIVVKNQTKEC